MQSTAQMVEAPPRQYRPELAIPEVTGIKQERAVIPRDSLGRVAPGTSLNPHGRPKGSRSQLGEDFAGALSRDFKRHGMQAIVAMREADPSTYCKVIASLMPKEVRIERPLEGLSDEDLQAAVATLQAMMAGATIEGESVREVDTGPGTDSDSELNPDSYPTDRV